MLGDRFLKRARRAFGGFRRASDGAAAIEFAILILPFTILVFAIFETFTAFAGEQLVSNAVDTMARKIRTGEITFGQGKSTDMTEAEFRQAFCDEIAIFHMCEQRRGDAARETLSRCASVQSLFGHAARRSQDLDCSLFGSRHQRIRLFPRRADSKNMLRAYYRWSVVTDLVRPYVANLKPSGETRPTQFLIVATSVFENEDYE